jgi:hypothetical protein
MPKIERKIIYKNPGLSAEDEIQDNGSDSYRIVLGCGYTPLKQKKAVGDNPDNNPKHNLKTVPRR